MSTKVCLALIHNNNQKRNVYIKPELQKLSESLSSKCTVKSIEASYQDAVSPHPLVLALMRDLGYFKLSLQWACYRSLDKQHLFLLAKSFTKIFISKYILDRKAKAFKWQKNSAIEMAVTDKHIRLWCDFLESDADYLLCFEDDAVFQQESTNKIGSLIQRLAATQIEEACYVDLGGGCDVKDLQVGYLEIKKDEEYRYYQKPITNTACAYLMSRKLVTIFYSILSNAPWLRMFGIDWLMNNLFIIMKKQRLECFCMHADPTIVKHGTTTGEYVSWQATN